MTAKKKPRTIKITHTISDDLCAGIMCLALEGGIGYWCAAGDIVQTTRPQKPNETYPDVDYVSFVAFDAEDHRAKFGKVTYDTVALGIKRILSQGAKINDTHKENVTRCVTNDDGAEIDVLDADCIIQFGLFGELVYG